MPAPRHPKKRRKTRKGQHTPGRPPSKSPRYCIQQILKIAPSTFVLEHHTTPRICDVQQVVELEELQCPICCDILRSPVELTDCRSVVCAECCCSWIDYCEDTSCPCCYSDHLKDFNTVRPASQLLLTLLGGLCVICSVCERHVRLELYNQHIHNGCQIYHNSPPQDTTIDEILSRPITIPLTSVEQKLHIKLAKRALASSPEENVLKIKNGGQVHCLGRQQS